MIAGELPSSFAFAPQGNMLAVSAPSGGIKLWDAATGKLIRSWAWNAGAPALPGRRGEAGVLSLAFSPDGKTLAGCSMANAFDGMPQTAIILWETATGNERLRLKSELRGLGGEFELEMIFMILDQMGFSVSYSPDGKSLLVGTFTSLHLLDAHTGKDVVSYAGRQMVGRTATFSRDGKLLFLGRVDGALPRPRCRIGARPRDFPAHTEPILTLTLSTDGKTLASGSSDSTVLLWDVAELAKPFVPAKVVYSDKELEDIWNDLAGPDAAKAYKAINHLAAVPAQATPLLKARITPIPAADPKVIEQLLDDLNSPKFPVRDKATADLEKLGDVASGAQGPPGNQTLRGS